LRSRQGFDQLVVDGGGADRLEQAVGLGDRHLPDAPLAK
jgi:hypothetical protein